MKNNGKIWSRGTNSRLPFGVNVNLNLLNDVTSDASVFHGGHLVMRSNRDAVKNQRISLRWIDTVFQSQTSQSSSLSINYVVINKDLEKLPPQLY